MPHSTAGAAVSGITGGVPDLPRAAARPVVGASSDQQGTPDPGAEHDGQAVADAAQRTPAGFPAQERVDVVDQFHGASGEVGDGLGGAAAPPVGEGPGGSQHLARVGIDHPRGTGADGCGPQPGAGLDAGHQACGGIDQRLTTAPRGGGVGGQDVAVHVRQHRGDLGASDVDTGHHGAVQHIIRRRDPEHQRPPSPARAMPFTRCFCSAITSAVVGTIEITAAAICRSHRVPCCVENVARPTGRVPRVE